MSTELNGTLTNSANLVGSFGATAGGTTNYNDLVNKPSINHVELTGNKSGTQLGLVSENDLSTVAFSGNYNDLLHKPTIPAAQVNSDWNAISGVAQILNKPTIPAAQVNSDWNSNSGVSEILNKPTLSTVATSGSYDDLTDKPTIPEAQVNSDWNAVSGVSEILNKPTLSTVATSGSYNDLTDTPTIPTNSDFNLSGLGDVSISGATQGQVLTKELNGWGASSVSTTCSIVKGTNMPTGFPIPSINRKGNVVIITLGVQIPTGTYSNTEALWTITPKPLSTFRSLVAFGAGTANVLIDANGSFRFNSNTTINADTYMIGTMIFLTDDMF